METVGDEAETVGPYTVQQLDEGEGQIQNEEQEQIAGILVGEDEAFPAQQLLLDPTVEVGTRLARAMRERQHPGITLILWGPSCVARGHSSEVAVRKSHKFGPDAHLPLRNDRRFRESLPEGTERRAGSIDQSRLTCVRHPQLFDTRQARQLCNTYTCIHTYIRAARHVHVGHSGRPNLT